MTNTNSNYFQNTLPSLPDREDKNKDNSFVKKENKENIFFGLNKSNNNINNINKYAYNNHKNLKENLNNSNESIKQFSKLNENEYLYKTPNIILTDESEYFKGIPEVPRVPKK